MMNYRAKKHSTLVLVLLGLDILIQAVQIGLNVKLEAAIDLLTQQTNDPASRHYVEQLIQFNHVLYYTKIVSFLLLGIAILTWIFRAHRFVHTTVNATNIKFTDAACVVYFFIPIANLFMPYKAMKETWLASEHPDSWRNQPTPITLVVWWILWLLYINFALMIVLVWHEYHTLTLIQEMTFITTTASVLSLLLSGIVLLIVLQIDGIQNKYVASTTSDFPKSAPKNSLVSE
ncbi:hypothetical protein I926_07355 [Pasteurella multocida subsp. multocida OH4807]|nr:hypothetical protein I926_07355 [Pasteurella multocida subsp. multocida OH4807]